MRATEHLGGVVDLDVAALAVDLDLRALLGGPLAVHVVDAEQAEEHVVVVEVEQRRRVGLQGLELRGSNAANASLVGANTTYGPFSRTGTMLTAGLNPPEIAALKVLTSRDAGQHLADRQVGQSPCSWAPRP